MMAMNVRRDLERSNALEDADATVDQFTKLRLPSTGREGTLDHWTNFGGHHRINLLVQAFHIVKVAEHRAQPHAGACGDSFRTRRNLASPDEFRHRAYDTLVACFAALPTAIGTFAGGCVYIHRPDSVSSRACVADLASAGRPRLPFPRRSKWAVESGTRRCAVVRQRAGMIGV